MNTQQMMLMMSLLVGLAGCETTQPKATREPTPQNASKALKHQPLSAKLAPYKGCMIIEQTSNDPKRTPTRWQYGDVACTAPRSPCSTFKVPHAMIGLQSGKITPEEIVKWDGKKRMFPAWNRPQTLASALKYSTVWFFQRLAKRIGPKAMRHHLTTMRYGNADISGGQDTFWLGKSLLITPEAQVRFLHQAARDAVPGIDTKHSESVWRALEPIHLPSGGIVQGKTGSCRIDAQGDHGWFIGKISHQATSYVFATIITQQPSKRALLGFAAKKRALATIDQWLTTRPTQTPKQAPK